MLICRHPCAHEEGDRVGIEHIAELTSEQIVADRPEIPDLDVDKAEFLVEDIRLCSFFVIRRRRRLGQFDRLAHIDQQQANLIESMPEKAIEVGKLPPRPLKPRFKQPVELGKLVG